MCSLHKPLIYIKSSHLLDVHETCSASVRLYTRPVPVRVKLMKRALWVWGCTPHLCLFVSSSRNVLCECEAVHPACACSCQAHFLNLGITDACKYLHVSIKKTLMTDQEFQAGDIHMLIHDICSSDPLHSVRQALGPPTTLQMTQFHSFLWLSNIPLYICTTSSLSIHLLMDT